MPARWQLGNCVPTADEQKLSVCVRRTRLNPPKTEPGAFEVTKRIAWLLRGEGAGLLIKNGGENIVSWKGYSFSAGRICYPDGQIYKVLTRHSVHQRPELAGQRVRGPQPVRAGHRSKVGEIECQLQRLQFELKR